MNPKANINNVIQLPVSKSLPQEQDRHNDDPHGLLSVKELSFRFGLSRASIYEFIKHDPTFPYKNVGMKKKYVANAVEFQQWLNCRTQTEKKAHFRIPDANELMERYRK